jgi:2-iminobutanoate/2-iminopropanoate deaminase
MPKLVIRTPNAPAPVARYSQGIVVDNTLYVQGIIALDPQTGRLVDGEIEAQSERVFKSIRAILDAAGMTMADIVKVSAFLENLSDYAKFNQVYDSCFQNDLPPVRTTVQTKLPFGALVEVEVIACKA